MYYICEKTGKKYIHKYNLCMMGYVVFLLCLLAPSKFLQPLIL